LTFQNLQRLPLVLLEVVEVTAWDIRAPGVHQARPSGHKTGAPGIGTRVTQHLLRCHNCADCDVVTLNTSDTHTPFTARVETMMRPIADQIATRTAIPNISAEVGFVNQTT
jgi:hypothetical protein